jgi:UDP-glucose 4-epimerase
VNYTNKKVAVTGVTGFLGNEIASALTNEGAEVIWIAGDTRDRKTFAELDYTYDYVFHFAAPSSQILFKRRPKYALESTLAGFFNVARACAANGVKLIYPSTGSLSSSVSNEYSRAKQICEDYADACDVDSLGLRIFATYGPGEGHKRDYASVPFLFVSDVLDNRTPVIFGDGTQKRDFIYIDDVVNAVLILAEHCNDRVIDVGSGVSHSFNKVVDYIGDARGQTVETKNIEKPGGYLDETAADISRLLEFYTPKVSLKDGIKRTYEHEKSDRNDND